MAPAALAQDVTALRDELRTSAVQYSRELAQERDRGEALARELARAQRDLETQVALSGKTDDEAAQVKAAESATAELRQSLQKERDRAEALARELATAQRDLETQVALSSKTDDEAAQVKQTAESATAELRQSLQKEHDRAEALAGEPARVQRDLKTQTALSRKIGDEPVQIRQAAETEAADLPQSRQKEGDSAAALARGLESTRRPIDARIALERAATSQINQAKPASEAAAAEQPAAAEVKGTPEAAKSLARANALLGQGNIGAGRVVRHPQRRGVHQIPSHQWRSGKCNLRQARHRLERAPRSKGMSYACYSRSQMRATSPSISPPEPAPPMTGIFR
jgi:hypothetical protein